MPPSNDMSRVKLPWHYAGVAAAALLVLWYLKGWWAAPYAAALGIAVLGYLIGFEASLQAGLYPFLLGDALKLVLAALIAKGVLKGAGQFAQL